MKHAVCVLLAVVIFTLAARADVPNEPGARRVFIGSGQALTVSAPRQLTLNAHVSQMMVQPGSLEAAYTSTIVNGDTVTQNLKLVGLRTGQTWTLTQSTSPNNADADAFAYKLVGWSGDGRFLVVSHGERQEWNDHMTSGVFAVYDRVDVGAEPFTVRRLALPLHTSLGDSAYGEMTASPSGALFAVEWDTPGVNGTAPFSDVFVYSAVQGTLRRIRLPQHAFFMGWNDDTHLHLYTAGTAHGVDTALDITTGTQTPAPKNSVAAAPPARAFPAVSLSLSEQPGVSPAPDGKTQADTRSLWLNIAQGKRDLATLCLAVSLGDDGLSPALVPNQSAALWLEHGDLYVSAFALDTATVRERYDNGDALTRNEEREIATDNAKRLGLGLLQYTQDYDEQFPPAANFHEGVYPYVKSERLFKTGNVPFQYAAPSDLHLSAMDDPAHTVLGTISLPCATVTLYADGHVQSLPPSREDATNSAAR